MKHRIVLALAAASVGGCTDAGTPNNSEGMSALTANNSNFRGGAMVPSPGNAPTNTGTGVTGGNGKATVTPQGYADSHSGKSGGNPANTGPAQSAPGNSLAFALDAVWVRGLRPRELGHLPLGPFVRIAILVGIPALSTWTIVSGLRTGIAEAR